ncbi:MAG: hypothetical protein Q4D53_01810 [Leptotrichiaceae bacterium]|nr:hypothetical protein [Leptotrichiaceae bacterium]
MEDTQDSEKYSMLIDTALKYEYDREYKKAEKYYRKAARHDKRAYYEIALMYYYNINMEKGIEKLEEAYKKYGITDAAKMLGHIAHEKNNTVEAEKWYIKSSEGGDVESEYYLGDLYERKGELAEAKTWYLKAAEKGDAVSMYRLIYIYFLKGNTDKMSEWKEKLLNGESVENITYNMKKGIGYMFGNKQQQKYFDLVMQADKYIKESKYKDAENKYMEAGNIYDEGNIDLGLFYYYDVGDREKGKTVLNNVHKKGVKGAAFHLGAIADKEKEYEKAWKWYEIGAEEGDSRAQYNLANLYYNEKDLVNAEKYYLMSANQKDGEAMYNLMLIYYDKDDMKNAKDWAEKILQGTGIENLTFDIKKDAIEVLYEVR